MAKLSAQRNRFVGEYLIDLNATQAAIRAGYSPKTAEQIAYQLLQIPLVQAAIQAAMQERQARTGISQDRVLKELEKVGFSEAADYADSALKYTNKLKALELLGKHLNLFDGKSAPTATPENNLFDAIVQSAEEVETDDIPEIEQAAAAGDDVVEQAELPKP